MLKYRRRLLGGVLAGIAVFILFSYVGISRANIPSDWLGTSPLGLQKEASLSVIPSSLNGNIDCRLQASSSCVIPTLYGAASSDGKVLLNNAPDSYSVFTNIDNQQHFQAIPNSNTVLSYSPSPTYGLYYYFNRNFSTSINKLAYFDFKPTYKYAINRPPDGQLGDQAGHLLAGDYTSISFSSDGHWMVISVPNVTMLRVNLDTFQVTPFGFGFNYTIGLDPKLQTAITNDGRYAVVSSKNFGYFKIFDLSTCGPVPATITGPVACQSRDLQSFMQGQVNGFVTASNIRFISDDTLSLYVTSVQGSSQTTAKYLLSTAGGGLHQQDYLTLGDSYISGEGAFDYEPGTDRDDNKCHVSLLAYSNLLGHDLGYNSYHSVACSGAKTDDVIDTSSAYLGQASPKTKISNRVDSQVHTILSNFQPGYIDQLDFVSQYQPKVITLSVGGNDMGFSDIIKKCIAPGSCYGSYEDRLELVREINRSVFPKLVNTYQQIKTTGAPDARIYVVGYPQIAKPGGNCADNVHLDADEVTFSTQLISYLDNIVQAAAARAGVVYVDTQNSLDGHRLCESASKYTAGVNGLSAGNDSPASLGGPFGNESYHPTALGHQLLEQAVMIATQGLTQPMPAANLNSAPPTETGLAILSTAQSGRVVNITEYDPSISDDVIYKGSLGNVSIDGLDHSLPPANVFQASLHSNPVALGSFTTDSAGNLSSQILIPSSVPTGYHTMHFYGSDLSDQAIDIYKTVYIAGSPNDLDGDGIPDNQDVCVGVTPDGQDLDQDGVDDACDGFISDPPPKQTQTPTATPAGSTVLAASQTNNATPPSQVQTAEAVDISTPQVLATSTTEPSANDSPSTPVAATKHPHPRLSPIYLVGFGLAATTIIAMAFAAKD